MHDTPRLVPPYPGHAPHSPCSCATATLVQGQCHSIYVRCGTGIIALEGDLLVAYRDPTLAWSGDAMGERNFVLREGEQHTFDRRGMVFISTARGAAARCAIQPPEPGLAATLARRWLARVAGWTRMRGRRDA